MAKKKTSKAAQQDSSADPLSNVETFDPKQMEGETAVRAQNKPVSPLGPPQTAPTPPQLAVSGLPGQPSEAVAALKAEIRALEKRNIKLEATVAQHKATIEELKAEREVRLKLEREMAGMEVEIRQVRHATAALEEERKSRLELERRLATLEVIAERAQEASAQLVEERQMRIQLEREKATLEVQVQSLQKLDTLLSEERQARMNAQSRASSAEARLARLEGEINQQGGGSGSRQSFLDRLRGRS
jgi:DNA repair exonuclease SbcCD ATPase subunit